MKLKVFRVILSAKFIYTRSDKYAESFLLNHREKVELKIKRDTTKSM